MSLPQIVGMPCVVCKKSIGSIVEGTYCDLCGNPLHTKCMGKVQPPADQCESCGGDPDSRTAKQVRGAWAALDHAEKSDGEASFPVGTACPNSGCMECSSYERPQRWVAYAWDRVCKECGMRYTPPTPLWAAFTFLGAGLVLSGFGLLGVAAGDVCMALLGLLGIMAILQGIRSLRRPGKV